MTKHLLAIFFLVCIYFISFNSDIQNLIILVSSLAVYLLIVHILLPIIARREDYHD